MIDENGSIAAQRKTNGPTRRRHNSRCGRSLWYRGWDSNLYLRNDSLLAVERFLRSPPEPVGVGVRLPEHALDGLTGTRASKLAKRL